MSPTHILHPIFKYGREVIGKDGIETSIRILQNREHMFWEATIN